MVKERITLFESSYKEFGSVFCLSFQNPSSQLSDGCEHTVLTTIFGTMGNADKEPDAGE